MKRSHKINHDWMPPASPLRSEAVTERYGAEVDASVKRAEKAWRRAQKNLERAEAKLVAAKTATHAKSQQRLSRRQMAELEALVEQRRTELEECYRQMVSVAASATHRGTKSYRPVPDKSRTSGL